MFIPRVLLRKDKYVACRPIPCSGIILGAVTETFKEWDEGGGGRQLNKCHQLVNHVE